MNRSEGYFLRHEVCEKCGSSDAKAVYSSGTAFCFSCSTFFPHTEDNSHQRRRGAKIGMIANLEYRALSKRKISLETCRKYGYGYGIYKMRLYK